MMPPSPLVAGPPVTSKAALLRSSLLLSGLLAGSVVQAHATALSVADIFSQFNVVTFNNFASSSDVEGRTVVGGNLTGGASFDIAPGSAAASSFASLTVY